MNSIIYVIFSYLCLSGVIVFLSLKLSDYIDWLDKKTKISGAFLGGVLLAMVTSLPEMFTSFSSVLLLGNPDMVIGNILGSNSFDVMVLGLCIIMFYGTFKNNILQFKSHFIVIASLFAIYIFLLIPLMLGYNQLMLGKINVFFILIASCYVLAILKMPKNDGSLEEAVETFVEQEECKLSVKQILVRFVLCSVLLVVASIFITYATDDIAKHFTLKSSTAGVLFLAIATSLPEVVSTIALCHKGNFDASFGNILGSCLFNSFVLSLAEFVSFKDTILTAGDKASIVLATLNVIALTATFGVIALKTKKEQPKKFAVIYTFFALLMIVSYALYYVF